MKSILLFIAITIIFVSEMSAQQLSSYGLFHMNQYLQSPAAAGSKPYVFFSTSYMQNWSGIKGAPNIQSATVHSLVSERVGLGGKIFYENTGLSGQFGAEFTYAYHMPLGTGGTKLSLGLSALLSQYSLHKDEFIIADKDDEAINNAENSIIVPDASFGFSIYKPNKFFINYGVYQLIDREVNFLNNSLIDNKRVRHHFLNIGGLFAAGKKVKLEPSAMLKLNEKGILQADLGIKSIFSDMFAIGVYYRTGEAILPFIGVDTKYVVFGYSYGIITSDVKKYSVGNHEIMLILKLNNSKADL
ncbi:MAG: type IX secretion system membrane protein PorP/SprF [Bacteroidia bacterium]|nr:type IX secretion system membrane protein PorP/SprF [Bacteroidia bacterium]